MRKSFLQNLLQDSIIFTSLKKQERESFAEYAKTYLLCSCKSSGKKTKGVLKRSRGTDVKIRSSGKREETSLRTEKNLYVWSS